MTVFKVIVTALNILFSLVTICDLAKRGQIDGSDAIGALIMVMVFISSSVCIWIN